jgi:hypothetical protein
VSVRLLVDVDVVIRRDHGDERLHTRHALCGPMVHAVASTGSAWIDSSTFEAADWQREIARTCRTAAAPAACPPPMPALEVPWDLLLGTGAALARHRADLYDVLVARAAGDVTALGRPLALAVVHTQVFRLHRAVVGRLRCTGSVPSARRVGWVSWLLYADGWRALTPYAGARSDGRPCPMVRIEPRTPDDLGYEVAGWAVAR